MGTQKTVRTNYLNVGLFSHEVHEKFDCLKDAAEAFGVSRRTLYKWLKGECNPSFRNLEKIASVLEIPTRNLITPDKQYVYDEFKHIIYAFFREFRRGGVDADGNQNPLMPSVKEVMMVSERLGYFESEDETETDAGISKTDMEIYERVKAQLASETMLP